MPEALKVKSLPGEAEKIAARQAKKDRRDVFAGKTFNQLNDNQKDKLLKLIAVQLGIINDNAD